MVTSLVEIEKAQTVVFQSLGLTLATAVCDQLERAGVPAFLEKAASGYVVLVRGEYTTQSHLLLFAHPKRGEIFFN